MRYYENIRLVYEIESRVRDLRRVATPQKSNNRKRQPPKNPSKSDNRQDKNRHNRNSDDVSQPVLAAFPAGIAPATKQVTHQARLKRRTA